MNPNNYSEKEIKEIIKEVLNELYKKDKILIKNETHEITISHKIACYLTNKFENWDVDCEYNRDLENPKECSYNSNETKYIRPDIIIHQRNIKNNLLVIEIKKNAKYADKQQDIQKLKCMIEKYNYKYALFINIQTETQKISYIWNFDKEFNEF
nr:hypothetical protein [Methanobrevibacter smithii]